VSAKVCVCGRRALPGSTRCASHQVARPSQSDRLRSQPWRGAYRDPEYARNRRLAYRRDGGRCVRCATPVGDGQWVCDHILPLSDGGTNDLPNLQTLCSDCNKTKTRADRRRRSDERMGA
jgi:5-methylcytosine-specific restriction enzyme A